MASTTRTKPPSRGTKQKAGRRLPPKVKAGPDVPLLPVVVAIALVLVAIGVAVNYYVNSRPITVPSAAGIPCDHLEHSNTHYHAALQIVYQGNHTPIPANIGIMSSPSCFYWLHVHQAYPDVIHIESPADRTFTLGDFFAVWDTWAKQNGKPRAPLDATHVSTFTLGPNDHMFVYVDLYDGNGPKLYTGDLRTIILKAHEIVTIEITAATKGSTPPTFSWSSTTNNGL